MSMFSRTNVIAAITTAGALASCSESTGSEAFHAYQKIDDGTYLIDGDFDRDRGIGTLGDNLATFRREVSGDFVIVLGDSRSVLRNDALALKVEVPAADGKVNRIIEIQGGGAAK